MGKVWYGVLLGAVLGIFDVPAFGFSLSCIPRIDAASIAAGGDDDGDGEGVG